MKIEIYEDLLFVNEATNQLTQRIEQLRDNKMLSPHYAELRVLAARMNCAEITGSIVSKLVKPEWDAAHRLEQELLKKTAKLAASQDRKPKKVIKARKKRH